MNKFRRGLLLWGLGLILGAVILLSSGCTNYTKTHKVSLGIMIGAAAADAVTLNQSLVVGAKELSPFLGENPSTGAIAFWTIGTVGLKWFAGHVCIKCRNWLWPASAVVNTIGTISNIEAKRKMEGRND